MISTKVIAECVASNLDINIIRSDDCYYEMEYENNKVVIQNDCGVIKFFVESKNKKACYNGQFCISDLNIKAKIAIAIQNFSPIVTRNSTC